MLKVLLFQLLLDVGIDHFGHQAADAVMAQPEQAHPLYIARPVGEILGVGVAEGLQQGKRGTASPDISYWRQGQGVITRANPRGKHYEP